MEGASEGCGALKHNIISYENVCKTSKKKIMQTFFMKA
jgi:hypothetical protein